MIEVNWVTYIIGILCKEYGFQACQTADPN